MHMHVSSTSFSIQFVVIAFMNIGLCKYNYKFVVWKKFVVCSFGIMNNNVDNNSFYSLLTCARHFAMDFTCIIYFSLCNNLEKKELLYLFFSDE